jgi:sec-independent protein translocase protein TatA
MGELVVILVIALIIFGAGKLPEIGSSLGKSIQNFKKASEGEPQPRIEAAAPPAAVAPGEPAAAASGPAVRETEQAAADRTPPAAG